MPLRTFSAKETGPAATLLRVLEHPLAFSSSEGRTDANSSIGGRRRRWRDRSVGWVRAGRQRRGEERRRRRWGREDGGDGGGQTMAAANPRRRRSRWEAAASGQGGDGGGSQFYRHGYLLIVIKEGQLLAGGGRPVVATLGTAVAAAPGTTVMGTEALGHRQWRGGGRLDEAAVLRATKPGCRRWRCGWRSMGRAAALRATAPVRQR
uniref:Uncharacterized protein n=1 Tax=Oryza glumipatula TaxID=40148 RepID=A0A0D9YSI1_9ORYZ